MSSLNRQLYRWAGLIIFLTAAVILILLLASDFSFVENWEQKIYIMNHFIIILGLILLSYSYEKIEDERIRTIRFTLQRFSHLLTILGIITYSAVSILERVEFNLYVIFYIIESALILYQLLFRLFLRLNPKWIFRESPRKNARSILVVVSLTFLIGWLIYVIAAYKI